MPQTIQVLVSVGDPLCAEDLLLLRDPLVSSQGSSEKWEQHKMEQPLNKIPCQLPGF